MMWLMFGVFFAAAGASLVITPLSMLLSQRLSLLDEPDARKVHINPVPRLGGIGIVGATLLVAVPAFAYLAGTTVGLDPQLSRQHLGVLLGAACVFVVGLVDDLTPVSSRLKLGALVAASCAVCGAGGAFSEIRTDGGALLADYSAFSWAITVAWIVGFAVAFNFIDGLDGLSGGLGLLASVVLAVFLIGAGCYPAAIAPLALGGAILGFLYFNWHPAKTFMGDCGSMTVGFLLGALAVTSNPAIGSMRAMALPGLAMSVALVDAALTLFRRRYQQRRSVFSAERGHIHHRLLDNGFSHGQVVFIIHAVSGTAVLIGMLTLAFEGAATLGGLLLVAPLVWGLFHAAGSVRTSEMIAALRRKHSHDRASRKFRLAFESLQLEFDAARNFSEWWQVVCNAADRLEFASVELPVGSTNDGVARMVRWVNPSDDFQLDEEQIDAKIPVTITGDATPTRVAAVKIPASICLESAGQRLALFSRLMAENGRESLCAIYHAAAEHQPQAVAPPPGDFGRLRVAVVHDYFEPSVGPEGVLEQIIHAFPHCDLFALFDFLPSDRREFLKHKPVTTTFIQRLPFARTRHAAYLPLMPLAIEQLDLSGYDLIISSSHQIAKGVLTGPDQLHICYCGAPSRLGWDLQQEHLKAARRGFGPFGLASRATLHYFRNWDARTSLGVDHFIADSRNMARRIEKVYRREAEVVHPPVDTGLFSPGPGDAAPARPEYYLTSGRLLPHNRVDVIIEAFNATPERRLLIAGEGPEYPRLARLARPNVDLMGRVDRAKLVRYMQRAKAFVYAAEEDFGVAPLEAMACGVPVIAYAKGGAAEAAPPGAAGYFYDAQTPESLLEAIARFEKAPPIDALDRKAARQRAERFSNEQFIERLTDSIRRAVRSRWPERLTAAPHRANSTAGPDHPAREPSAPSSELAMGAD